MSRFAQLTAGVGVVLLAVIAALLATLVWQTAELRLSLAEARADYVAPGSGTAVQHIALGSGGAEIRLAKFYGYDEAENGPATLDTVVSALVAVNESLSEMHDTMSEIRGSVGTPLGETSSLWSLMSKICVNTSDDDGFIFC